MFVGDRINDSKIKKDSTCNNFSAYPTFRGH